MFKEKKYCKTVIAILLVFCFTFTNCFTLFTNISLATEESLGKQASESIDENVEYDAKFEKSNIENGYELQSNIAEEDIGIHIQLEIKKEGYLKNAKILIESENGLSFELLEEKNEKYQIEGNKINLSNISSGEKLDIVIPIRYKQRDDIENLNKKINVKLIGTYVKNNGKESGISENVVLKLVWNTNTEYNITSELRKYIPYNKGIILQTSVTSILPEENNYIEKEELEIEALRLDEYKVEKIIVSNKAEEELKETEWNYNEEENKINIKLQDSKTSLKSNEYLITYILSGNKKVELPFNLKSKINGSIFMFGTNEKVDARLEKEYEIKENTGNIVSVDSESTKSVKLGNILNNSLAEENSYKTNYQTKFNIDISSTEMCENVLIKSNQHGFENENGTNNTTKILFKQVKVSKDNFEKILGQDGEIQLISENNEIIATINKNSKTYNNEYIEEINTDKIIIKTSTPQTEGILSIVTEKEITKTEYSYEQIKTFSNINEKYTASILYDENAESKISDIENKIELEKSETNAELTISRKTLSTITDNNDIKLEIKLNNSSENNDLYKNPEFYITFPEYINDVNVKNVVIANSEEVFTITKSTTEKDTDGRIKLNIALEGTQTKYNSNILSNGTSIIINCNIKLDLYTPTKNSKIEMKYINENASKYRNKNENIGYAETEVEYKAPTGVVSINKISNYENTGKTITSVNQGKVTDRIEIFDDEKIATMDIMVMNNNENNCNDIKILGRIPFKGNKDVTSGKELGTTINTELVSKISEDINNKVRAIIYYSNNGEATEDLNNSDNNWTTDIENISNVKSYLIVLENYEMMPGEILKYTYQYKIPANLEHNANIYSSFKTMYKNLNQVTNIKETSTADIVGLTTGTGPQLAVQTITNVKENVKEYEKIKYTVTIENTGTEVAENIKINTKIPTGGTVATHSSYNSVESTKGWTLKSDREIVTTIEKLNAGDIKKVEFFVQANKLPTIEEYYAGVEGFTKNEDGTYSINQSYIDENGTTKYEENKINSIPEIKLVSESIITAKDLAKEIKINDSGIVVEKSNLVAEETVETKDSIAAENETIESKIQIKNNSNSTMKNIIVVKVLPEGLNYSDSYIRGYEADGITLKKIKSTDYDSDTRTVTWKIDELNPGRTVQIAGEWVIGNLKENTYKDTIATNSKILVNGEEYQAGEVDITVGKANLEVKQTSDQTNQYVKVGDQIKYTFTVKNTGSVRANNVTLTDILPDELTIKKLVYTVDGVEVSKVVSKNEDATVYTSILPDGKLEATVTAEVNNIGVAQRTISNVGKIETDNISKISSNEVVNIIEKTSNITGNIIKDNEIQNDTTISEDNDNSKNETVKDKYDIKGIVWLDKNKNSERDNEDSKLSGIEVKLVDSKTAKQVDKTVTNQDGEYKFSNLENGTYIVMFYYDNTKYAIAEYKKPNITEDRNSDVITTNENNKIVATTDVITIEHGSKSNIDMGLIEASTFDLALSKTISKVTVQTNENTKTYDFNNTNLAKVDINAKYLSGATVIVEYTFTVKNEGELEGDAKQLVDYMPKDLEFNTELNKNWHKGNDGNLYNEELANEPIASGESKTIKLVLTKAMTDTNTGIVNNQAEISKDYNKAGIADKDSTPGNQSQKDDDMSSADLIIGVKTGETLIYISAIIAGIVAIIITAVLIKKNKLILKIQSKFGKEV